MTPVGSLVLFLILQIFTCLEVGSNLVELTVTDVNNNSATCTATVTVEDNTDPVAVCKPISVNLNSAGTATIANDSVDGGSTDACGGLMFATNITSFDCDDIAVSPIQVTLTVTDANSNSSTCTAQVNRH